MSLSPSDNVIINPPTEDETRDLAREFAERMNVSESGANTPSKPQVSPAVKKDYALLNDPEYHTKRLEQIRQKKGYIIDMDGVIYHVSIHIFGLLLLGWT